MTFDVGGATAADIVAFYKKKGEAAGFKAALESVSGDAHILAMSDNQAADDGTTRGFQVTVTPYGEGGTSVALVYTGGK